MRRFLKEWNKLNPILAEDEVGEIIGMLETKTGDGKTPWVDLLYKSELEVPSMLFGAGSPVVRKFPFAFDTIGLLTGHEFYTPTVGDVLLDGWVQIDTAWDGTTPKLDFGPFLYFDGSSSSAGLLQSYGSSVIDLTQADDNSSFSLLLSSTSSLTDFSTNLNKSSNFTSRYLPTVFVAAAPLKIVVSTTGQTDGADPGSTQGSGTIYLVTATPI